MSLVTKADTLYLLDLIGPEALAAERAPLDPYEEQLIGAYLAGDLPALKTARAALNPDGTVKDQTALDALRSMAEVA